MAIVFTGIVPHPPIMVPEVGGREAEKTKSIQDALFELGRQIKSKQVDSLVFISPHTLAFQDAIAIWQAERLSGDLSNFGAPQVNFDLPVDQELAAQVEESCAAAGVPTVRLDKNSIPTNRIKLDHGTSAPLYWLQKAGVQVPVLVAGIALLPNQTLYKFGEAIKAASEKTGKNVALLASGDLSHRLTPDAPAGYSEKGALFDQCVLDLISQGDASGLLEFDAQLAEEAGECGLRPIIMMLGALKGKQFKGEILAYASPFGVGYLVSVLHPQLEDNAMTIDPKTEAYPESQEHLGEEFLVWLARTKINSLHRPEEKEKLKCIKVPDEFLQPGGVFVTINKQGRLRGCIGTVRPVCDTIYEEVLRNAVLAAQDDPRFPPVSEEELLELVVSVDVLSPLQPVSDVRSLDPKKHGVLVTAENRSGLLLPDLDGVDSVEEQLAICKEKAGLPADAPVAVHSFTVTRYT